MRDVTPIQRSPMSSRGLFLRIMGVLALLLVGAYLVTLVTRLLSAHSNLAVALGAMLALFLVGTGIWIGLTYLPKILRSLGLLAVVFVAYTQTGCGSCSYETIEPGYVGIRLNLYGSQKGVEKLPVETGRIWYNPWSERIYVFPTFMQRYPFTEGSAEGSPQDEAIRFTSKEGVQLTADVSVNLTFKAENVPELFATFRKDANGIVVGYVRDRIRNAMNDEGSSYTAMELVSTKQEEFMGKVNKRLAQELEEKGILLDSVSLLKRPTPPAKVDEAINMALAATQQAIAAWNQVEQTKAQAEQAIQEAKGKAEAARQAADGAAYAQMAKAKADAYTIEVAKEAEAKGNLELSQSITPSLVEYLRVKQWNGSVPYLSGGGAIPLISLPAPKASQ